MNNYDLLENIRHNLVSISGLKAFDNLGESVTSTESHVTVNISELIPLDYTDLINKIDDALDGDDSINAFVLDNCIEWSNLITELSLKESELMKHKEDYDNKEFEIVYQSDIDFKALYGSTSEKVRKQHAKTELKELNDEIKDLELSIDYLKRRINFLRQLVSMKTALIEVKNE